MLGAACQSTGDTLETSGVCLPGGTAARCVPGEKNAPLGSRREIAPGEARRRGREAPSTRHSRVFARRKSCAHICCCPSEC